MEVPPEVQVAEPPLWLEYAQDAVRPVTEVFNAFAANTAGIIVASIATDSNTAPMRLIHCFMIVMFLSCNIDIRYVGYGGPPMRVPYPTLN